jgi:hypothetical protein
MQFLTNSSHRYANDIRFFKGWLLRQRMFQKPYLEGEAEGEADPEGVAGASDPPPQAPRVVAIPRIRTVAKTLIFIVLNSSLQQMDKTFSLQIMHDGSIHRSR